MSTDTPTTGANAKQSSATREGGKSAESLEQMMAAQLEQQKALDASMAQLRTEYAASMPVTTQSGFPTMYGGVGLLVMVSALWFFKYRKRASKDTFSATIQANIPDDASMESTTAPGTGRSKAMVAPAPDLPLDLSLSATATATVHAAATPVSRAQDDPAAEPSVNSIQAALEAESSWMGDLDHEGKVHVNMEGITSWDTSLAMAKEFEKLGQWEEAASIYEQAMQRGDPETQEKARKSLSTLLPGT